MTEINVFEVYDSQGKRIAHAPLICDDTQEAERILRRCNMQFVGIDPLRVLIEANDIAAAQADGKAAINKYTCISYSDRRTEAE